MWLKRDANDILTVAATADIATHLQIMMTECGKCSSAEI